MRIPRLASILLLGLGSGCSLSFPDVSDSPDETSATLSGQLSSPLEIDDWPSRASVAAESAEGTQLGTVTADGGFSVTLAPGEYRLRVRVLGHEDDEQPVSLGTEDERLRPITLVPRRVELAARVVDGDGSPVADVVVRALRGERLAGTTLTSPAGRFVLPLTPETHALSFSRDGFEARAEVFVDWKDEALVPRDGEAPFVLSALPVATLSGRLVSALDVDDWSSRAVVTLTSADETVNRLAPVLRDGRFEFAGLTPGPYEVAVFARGHNPQTLEVDLTEGENGPLEIPLVSDVVDEDAYVLTGRVRLGGVPEDADHSGVAVRGRIGGNLVFATVTDDAGTFVTPVARDTHQLSLSHAGFAPADGTLTWLAEAGAFAWEDTPLAEVAVFATLAPLDVGSLRGVLRSPLGVEDWPGRAFVTLFGEDAQRLAAVSTNEDGDGAFEVDGLRPGAYTLSVDVRGHQPLRQEIEVPAEPLLLDPIELTPNELRYGAAVVDEDGAPVEGVLVRARIGDNVIDQSVTDRAGRFTLALVPETHGLSFTRAGYARLDGVFLDWADGDFAVRDGAAPFVLERITGELRITVDVAPAWIPEAQRVAQVRVVGEGVDRAEAGVADGTTAVFGDLAAGTYVVFAERPGFRSAQALVTLNEDEPNQALNLRVELASLSTAGLDLRGVELTDAALRSLNLAGANLSGVVITPADGGRLNLCGATLTGVDLVGTNLNEAALVGADLAGANLSNAGLTGAILAGADLTGTTLFGANLEGALFRLEPGVDPPLPPPADAEGVDPCADARATVFDSTDFSDANLSGARFTPDGALSDDPTDDPLDCRDVPEGERLVLTGVDFSGANLSAATLVEVDLSGVDLSSASLQGASLAGAAMADSVMVLSDLSDADFRCARLDGASFLGSVLANTDFQSAALAGALLTEAVVDGTRFLHADLTETRFIGVLFASAQLSGANLQQADLRNAEFVDAEFHNGLVPDPEDPNRHVPADLRHARLNNANLADANLRGVDLSHTNLRGADLNSANLRQAMLVGAETTGANFVGANLVDADLTGALLADVGLEGNNPGRRAFYSAKTKWPDVVPIPKVVGNPCPAIAPWPEGVEDPHVVPAQAHLVHPCANLSAERRNVDQVEEEEALDIRARAATDLTNADLRALDLRAIDLTLAILRGADLRGLDLRGASLRQAELEGAILRDPPVLLADANLRGVDFRDADLSGFDLSGAGLQGASLRDVNLTGANLTGAFLQGADLGAAELDGADVTGAQFDRETLWPDGFDPVEAGALDKPDDFVRIEPGDFLMYSPSWPTRVAITRPFLISKTEVTREKFGALVGGGCILTQDRPDPPPDGYCLIELRDALRYLNALSAAESLDPCYDFDLDAWNPVNGVPVDLDCEGYRLPTDAEWGYAARAGTQEATHPHEGWCGFPRGSSLPLYEPNAWGLSDTYSVQPEWTADQAHSRNGCFFFSQADFFRFEDGVVDPVRTARGCGCVVRGYFRDGSSRNFCDLVVRAAFPCERWAAGLRPVRTLRVPAAE